MTQIAGRERSYTNPGELRQTVSFTKGGRLLVAHPAWLSLVSAVLLSLLGVACIATTESIDGGLGPFSRRQLGFIVLGLVAAGVAAIPHYRFLGRLTPLLVISALALLVLVLAPGVPEWLVRPRNGARRWVSLGVTDFQPSELAKIAFVIAIAWYLRYRKNQRRLVGLIPPAIIMFVPMGLILVEPDLGTAALFVPAFFAMLVAAGAKLKHIVMIVVVSAAISPAMYPLLQPHQKDRINAMVNQITGDRQGRETINYQGDRAMDLAGAGGVAGLGNVRSRAIVHFNRLPEDHNDMVFAVVVNRFGLFGGLATLALYMAWVTGALLTAGVCKDPFGRLVCVGLAAMIAAQTTVNVGMTIGLLPITGMTLPFVSYGGSSLIAAYLMTGLVFNVGMRPPRILARESFEFTAEEDLRF